MRRSGDDDRRATFFPAAALTFFLTVGCQEAVSATPSKEDADELLVVDCLLPGQVRKLGQSFTFLTPRRPAKLPARECEIRGGEYTSYDRADYGTALKVWLGEANQGNPEAQTYVGEIYEKGLGIQPDYKLAAQWYLKAADQGYSRAAINLGHLYEQGLGVPKNLVTAFNWYRKASGLAGGDLEFVSSVEVSSRQQQIDQLRTALTEQTQQTATLRSQLDSAERALNSRIAQLAVSQQELTKLRSRAQQREQTVSAQTASPAVESTEEYQKLLAELQDARAGQERLRAQAEHHSGEAKVLQTRLTETRGQLEQQRSRFDAAQGELDAMRSELARRKNQAQTQANREEVARLARELEDREQRLAKQRQKMTWLERELVEQGSSLSDELRAAREKERQLSDALVERDAKVATLDTGLIELQTKLLDQDALSQQQKSILAERDRLTRELEAARREQQMLRADVAHHQSEVRALRQQLNDTQMTLDRQRLELSTAQGERDRIVTELARRQSAEETQANLEEIARLKRDLQKRERGLRKQRQQTTRLEQELAAQTKSMTDELRAAWEKEQELVNTLGGREAQVAVMQSELARLRTELLEQRAISDEQMSAIAERDRLTKELQAALPEQERLLAQVARQQGEAQALESQLVTTQSQLSERKVKLERTRQDVASLKAELSNQQSAANAESKQSAEKIAELERKLDMRQDMLKVQREEAEWLSTEIREQRAVLTEDLELTNAQLAELKAELNARDERVLGLRAKLEMVEADLQAERSASAQSDAELEGLNRQIREREAEIARQQEEISTLESSIAKEKDSATTEPELASVTPDIGPTIELIEPPLSATRGVPSIKLRSDLKELELIGRIKAPGGLITFRVNDRDHPVEKTRGIFKVKIPLRSAETPIHLVAVDNSGDRTVLDFALVSGSTGGSRSTQSQSHTTRPVVPGLDVFGNYHALIVGNNQYVHFPDLKTARTDAQAVARVLETKYGFRTTLLLDATRYDFLSALNDYRKRLNERDNLLIYYAGHGELDKKNLRAYWLPADAESGSTANWISNVEITDILNVMSAKHVLVVADSCYSGALTRTAVARLQPGMTDKAQLEWYEVMAKTRSRIVLTSGGVKPVLDAGGGQHSVFAKAFLDVLNENQEIMESYDLYRSVSERVAKASTRLRIEQEPQFAPIKYAGHEAGEFFFSPKRLARIIDSRIIKLSMLSLWSTFPELDAILHAPG